MNQGNRGGFLMSITRINEFRAVPGSSATVQEQISLLVSLIESAQGCLSCQLLQSQKDQNHFIVIEVWDDVQSHQASLKAMHPEIFEKLKQHLNAPPTGEYYEYCHVR
jgi:quinol monooxygenase YgiN